MPKARLAANKGLPARWQVAHGAYYYRVPPGLEALWDGKKKFRLGKTLSEAYKAFADRVGFPERINTIGQLLDRYLLEVVPTKAPKTQTENKRHVRKLRGVFSDVPLTQLEPQHVYQYVAKRTAKVAAHREVEVLSHAFTKAVEWGLLKKHPFKGEVRLEGESHRTRYVEDWEIVEAMSIEPRRKKGSVWAIHAYMRLKLLTGMSKGDLLRLEPAKHFKDDGIHVQRHKTRLSTGKRTIYEWTDDRRAAVYAALAARPTEEASFLFCTATGGSYVNEARGTTKSWDKMWQKFMRRVRKETKLTEHFTDHDMRAKCASDADTLEKARALLAHVDSRITARIYRRKPERV